MSSWPRVDMRVMVVCEHAIWKKGSYCNGNAYYQASGTSQALNSNEIIQIYRVYMTISFEHFIQFRNSYKFTDNNLAFSSSYKGAVMMTQLLYKIVSSTEKSSGSTESSAKADD